MAKTTSLPEKTVDLGFPRAGIDRSQAFDRQLARGIGAGQYGKTTILGKNVQVYEALTRRGRGGSAPCIAKYIAGQVPTGSGLIQELNVFAYADSGLVGTLATPTLVQSAHKAYYEGGDVPSDGFTPSTGADTVALVSSVTVGNVLLVIVAHDTASQAPQSVTDTLGTTYSLITSGGSSSSTNRLLAYVGVAPSSGTNTITVNRTNFADAITIAVMEWSGVGRFDAIDGTNTTNNTGTNDLTTGSVSINQASSVLIGCFTQGFDDTQAVWSAGSGFTTVVDQEINGITEAVQSLHVEYKSGLSASTAATATGVGLNTFFALGFALKPLASDGPTASQSGRVSIVVSVSAGKVASAFPGGASWNAATNASSHEPEMNATGLVRSTQFDDYLYLVDGTHYKRFSPRANRVEDWTPTTGSLPRSVPNTRGALLICTWGGRIVLANNLDNPQQWWMSKIGDPLNWLTDVAVQDTTEAVSHQNKQMGHIGRPVFGLIPFNDDILLMGCDSELWMLQGNPAGGGSLQRVSDGIGIAWGNAWCKSPDGTVYFVSNAGRIYSILPGGKPQWTSQQIEPLLTSLDSGSTTVRLGWDDEYQCVRHFFTTAASAAAATHYVYENRCGAYFQRIFGNTSHNPQCLVTVDGNAATDRALVIGSWDGYVRGFSSSATTDDGTALTWEVWLGPICDEELNAFMLKDLQGTLVAEAGEITVTIYTGATAQAAFNSSATLTRTWTGISTTETDRTYTHPIARSGYAIYVKLSGTGRVGFERLKAHISPMGPVFARGNY